MQAELFRKGQNKHGKKLVSLNISAFNIFQMAFRRVLN